MNGNNQKASLNNRQASATKRRPGMSGAQTANNNNFNRNTQAAGWANGQLPVAMQQ